ncbi:helix-turn-helix domain-containing protein [Streptomyces asiaticus]|uniref:helix-turn-helix domain-containing protein n=1 Tax=Streptomyces asiaticus TaxID=114695 RepID=UPI003F67E9DA
MRANEGLAAARAHGRAGGRKPKLTPAAIGQTRLMYEARGADSKRLHSIAEIADAFNVTRGTIYRAMEKTEQSPAPRLQSLTGLLAAGAEADER